MTGSGGPARVLNLPVCKHHRGQGGTHRGRRANKYVLRVGVAKYLQSDPLFGREDRLLARVGGRLVVRGRPSSPIPAQQPTVIGGSEEVRQGDGQG